MAPRALDANRSAWVTEAGPVRATPPLRGRVTADVAIVGGGLTGVSTAWHLSGRMPGRGIVLLEAGLLGHGASGRNGGQVLNWINGIGDGEPERLRRIHATTSAGIDLAETLAGRYAPPGTFRRGGALEVFTDAARADAAHARAERLAALGIPTRFLPGTTVPLRGAYGALLDPGAGRLNGFALLQAMRPVLGAQGVAVHEHTPVRRIREGRTIVLTTPHAEVHARAIVLATNAYTPAVGYFRGRILPLHSHVIATAPLPADAWTRLGWHEWDAFADDLDRIAYACRTPGDRLLFGGGGNPAYSYRFGGGAVFPHRERRRHWTFLRDAMLRYVPELAHAPVEQRWTGPIAITLDRVCSMGVRGAHRNVYFALGYSGHGVALALLAGRVLTDLFEGNHEAWRDLPFYQRRLPLLPPEPLRWVGYHAYTRLTGRSPRRPA